MEITTGGHPSGDRPTGSTHPGLKEVFEEEYATDDFHTAEFELYDTATDAEALETPPPVQRVVARPPDLVPEEQSIAARMPLWLSVAVLGFLFGMMGMAFAKMILESAS